MSKLTTKVGTFNVPVRQPHFASIVSFTSGEHGVRERGHFLFWTAVIKNKRGRGIIGRAHYLLPPGDRFDRMKREMLTSKTKEDRDAYRKMYVEVMKQGKNVAYIRPSTLNEIIRWVNTHQTDSQYIIGVDCGHH